MLNVVESPDAAMDAAQRVLASLASPIVLDNGQHVLIGASIGVALFHGHAVESLPALMDRADRALYASKRNGKGLATFAEASGATGDLGDAVMARAPSAATATTPASPPLVQG